MILKWRKKTKRDPKQHRQEKNGKGNDSRTEQNEVKPPVEEVF